MEISSPEDEQEKEADEIARKVVGGQSIDVHGRGGVISRKTEKNPIQRKCEECEKKEREEKESVDAENSIGKVQMKCEKCEGEERRKKGDKIQRKADDGPLLAPAHIGEQIQMSKGTGQSLSDSTQEDLGGKMNADFSDVKIHTDTQSHEMNQELGAKAFTYGNDIYFNKGEYNPETQDGKLLLAHELTHTIQQKGGGSTIGKVQKQNHGDGDEDRSVLSLETPWSGVITGASLVGFHKEPGTGNNIEPGLKEGDKVTVLSVGENNWLKVSRIGEGGKKEIGYVDWRYVKQSSEPKKKGEQKEEKRDETRNDDAKLKKYKTLKVKLQSLDGLTVSGSSFSVQSDLETLKKKISVLRSVLKQAGPLAISETEAAIIQSKVMPLALALSALPVPGIATHQQAIAGFATYSFAGPAGAAALEIFLAALEAVIAFLLSEVILVILIIVAIVLLIIYVIEHFDEIVEAIKELAETLIIQAICAEDFVLCDLARQGNWRINCALCQQICIQARGVWPEGMCPLY